MVHRKSVLAVVAALFASVAVAVSTAGHVTAIVGAGNNGIIDITNGGQCSAGTDAYESAWNWEKPLLEVSTNSGGSWASAQGSTSYGAMVCRDVGQNGGAASYWFIIMKPDGNTDDLGALPDGTQFRVTVPMKSGDTALRLMGYSKVISFVVSNGRAVAIVKESPVAKVDMGNGDDFYTNHPECRGLASSPGMAMSLCKIQKADRDRAGTVIQNITYTSSTPSAYELLTQGTWIGANVNGFNLNMTCGANGNDNSSGNSGGNYSGGDRNDGGANKPADSAGSLEVSMSGTPHYRSDGATINTGNLQAFVPESAARKCFGDGTDTIALTDIAKAVSVTRTESTEGTKDVTAFTATAVIAPVPGLMIDVPNMTFSNPTYKVKTSLTKSSTSSSKAKAVKKGKSATLKSLLKPATGAKNTKYTVTGGCSISGTKLIAKKKGTCTLKLRQTVKGKTTTTSQKITVS